MILYRNSVSANPDYSASDINCHQSIKASFVQLMRFQHRARWSLMRSRLCFGVSVEAYGTILCSQCKHDCYLAYVSCSCLLHPVCLRHELYPEVFPCGGSISLVTRQDLSHLEAAAKKFEQDDAVMKEFNQFIGIEDSRLLSTLFPVKNDEYLPYCDINIEPHHDVNNTLDQSHSNHPFTIHGTKIVKGAQIAINMSDTSLSTAASTLCSFRVNDSSPIDNVPEVTNSSFLNQGQYSSHSACQSSLSSLSCNDCFSSGQGNFLGSEFVHNVDQCSRDSDSEIFRVKRRSSMKLERRNVCGLQSYHAQDQALKRPKKLKPIGRHGDAAPDYESSYSRTCLLSGIKGKRTLSGSSLKQTDKSMVAKSVQNTRERPSIEMAYKRPKVKGPSFMGSNSMPGNYR